MRRVGGSSVRSCANLPSKLAFSFIFTKTDALLGGTDSRAAVLTKLKQVLIETLQGTNDGDQKEFINWLITCIHYDNSLVDVYHPAFSEVDRLRSAIETFEKPSDGTKPPTTMALRSPRTDVRCGLTPKAESRIKLDLDAARRTGHSAGPRLRRERRQDREHLFVSAGASRQAVRTLHTRRH